MLFTKGSIGAVYDRARPPLPRTDRAVDPKSRGCTGEHDILVVEVKTLKEENKDLRNNLEQRVKEEGNMKRDMNDHEQHSRQFNVRVYGVPEVSGGTETVNDCVDRCLEVFSTKIGLPVSKADIEMAHRTGKPGGPRPGPSSFVF
ncbi:hypothetical protein ACOMHN_005590 [Nucella lapillus]